MPGSFNRRTQDANVDALRQQVKGLEDHVHGAMMPELRANTILTKQMHARTEEMWEVFESTRNGFRMIASIGNAGVKLIEVGGKIARPLVWIAALTVAGVGFLKTGQFTLPDWLK